MTGLFHDETLLDAVKRRIRGEAVAQAVRAIERGVKTDQFGIFFDEEIHRIFTEMRRSDLAIFQDLLRNDESPYYQAIDFLLRSNDPEALRQFGINIGYNAGFDIAYSGTFFRWGMPTCCPSPRWSVFERLM